MLRSLSVFVMALMALFALGGNCLADQPPAVFDQVEEDWQLVISLPDMVGAGPQVTTSMSPTGDLASSPFVAFDLNYREYPKFAQGGMQIQVWSNKQLLGTSTQGSDQCSTPNETITWTQRLSVSGGTVTYVVVNGQSTTWGQFGPGFGLSSVSFSSPLTSLAGYTPAFSVANSGVSWESNFVSSMKLVQVRYYLAGQLLYTDSTVRAVRLSD